ncbi:MAG TPA: GNAT family protein [Alphaproteobacteria bacterium]|nr:GNAT family protein [Alphaproteobacteria bacterium]
MRLLRPLSTGSPPPPARLMGRRVYLRLPDDRDWRPWADLRAASRDFLVPWEPTWPPDALTRDAFRRRLRRYGIDWREDTGYSFFIFRQGDHVLLGGVTLGNIRRGVAQSGTLGYWVGGAYARQGYMTDALNAVIAFAFQTLQLHRLEAACLPSNAPSQGVLRKLGFRQEGLARKYLRINGEWHDHLLFALLAEDAGYQVPSERAVE